MDIRTTIRIGEVDVPCDGDVLVAVAAAGLDLQGGCEGADETDEMDMYTCHRWHLADGRCLYVDCDQGIADAVSVGDGDMDAHLANWAWDEMGYESLSEWIAAWEYDGLQHEVVAGAGYAGPCRVWHETFKFTRDNCRSGFARDAESGEIIEFADYSEAEDYVLAYRQDITRSGVSDELTIVEARRC